MVRKDDLWSRLSSCVALTKVTLSQTKPLRAKYLSGQQSPLPKHKLSQKQFGHSLWLFDIFRRSRSLKLKRVILQMPIGPHMVSWCIIRFVRLKDNELENRVMLEKWMQISMARYFILPAVSLKSKHQSILWILVYICNSLTLYLSFENIIKLKKWINLYLYVLQKVKNHVTDLKERSG